jgi:hypothetical protein
VGHDQRQRVLVLGLDVHEVDVHAVDLSGELRQRVQPGFDPPSLVLCRPVLAQRLHRGQLHTLRAVADKLPARPARRRQAAPQIVERVFGICTVNGRMTLPACCSSVVMSGTASLSEPGAEKSQIRPGRQAPSRAA